MEVTWLNSKCRYCCVPWMPWHCRQFCVFVYLNVVVALCFCVCVCVWKSRHRNASIVFKYNVPSCAWQGLPFSSQKSSSRLVCLVYVGLSSLSVLVLAAKLGRYTVCMDVCVCTLMCVCVCVCVCVCTRACMCIHTRAQLLLLTAVRFLLVLYLDDDVADLCVSTDHPEGAAAQQ